MFWRKGKQYNIQKKKKNNSYLKNGIVKISIFVSRCIYLTSVLIFVLIFLVITTLLVYLFLLARKDIFQPILVSGAIFIVFYILDIVYILFDMKETNSFPLSSSFFYYKNVYEISFITIVCILMWFLGDFLVSRKSKIVEIKKEELRIDNETKFRFVLTFSIFISAVMLLQLLMFFQFINSIGGIVYYYEHIADRALIFSENTLLYASIQLTTVVGSIAAGYFSAIMTARKTNLIFKASVISLIIIIMGISLLTGARANILKSIIIILVIVNYFGKKIKLNFKLVAGFVIFASLMFVFAQQTRNVNVNTNESTADKLFNGVEISQVNNVMILEQFDLVGQQQGKTIVGGLLSFIPSSLYEQFGLEKPPGGNQEFTKKIWFERWDRAKSEVALGLLGEIVLNFKYYVAPIIFFILGTIYRFLYDILIKKQRLGILGYIMYIGLIWSIFQLLRGDFYNTINNLTIYIFASLVTFGFIKFTIKKKKLTRNISARV